MKTHPYCTLKCKVTPSQRVSTKPYNVYVIIEKDSPVKPGGRILSAYCTCTAGLHGSGNHIAGLLFRIESAMLRGLTKPTCTDRFARWSVPPAKTELNPCEVSKLIFKKDHSRTSMSIDRDRQAANVTNRRLFSPLSPEQEIYVENREKVRSDLYNLIKIHEPKCCFVELMEGKKLNQKIKQDTPSSLTDRVKLFKYDDKVTVAQNLSNFTDSIKLTDREIDIIKQNTVGQALV